MAMAASDRATRLQEASGGAANAPDRVQCYQPYGVEGLLVASIDPGLATGQLAASVEHSDASSQHSHGNP